MFKKLKLLLTAGAVLLASAIGASAATTRYAEIRSTLQPNTTGQGVFLGSSTIQNLNVSTLNFGANGKITGVITDLSTTTYSGGQTFNIASASTFTATTQFLGPNGSLAMPSYAFTNDTKTGMFRSASATIDMVVGGTRAVQMDNGLNTNIYGNFAMQTAGKQILANDGTSLLPAISFNSDPNNGFRRSSSNNFEAVANAVDVASFTIAGVSLRGTTTNDSAGVGWIGQVVSSSSAGLTPYPSTSNYGDLAAIALTAGDWDVTGCVLQNGNGATITSAAMGISQTSGNSTTGLSDGDNWVENSPGAVSGTTQVTYCIPNFRVSLSGSSTVYLKYASTFTVATPKGTGRLSARRAR